MHPDPAILRLLDEPATEPRDPAAAASRPREVPQANGRPHARFLFRLEASRGWVMPSGLGSASMLADVPAGAPVAVGGILVEGDTVARAIYAVPPPPALRERSDERLRTWAAATGWALTIDAGADGTPVRPFPGAWHTGICLRCRRREDLTNLTGARFARHRAWTDHRCRCGGHRVPLHRDRAGP